MPVTIADPVRAYQLPTPTPEQLYLSQFGLGGSNQPIQITPGFGGSASSQLPPIQTGQSRFESTTTFYVVAAQSEVKSS